MPPVEHLFATQIYQARPQGARATHLRSDLEHAAHALASSDRAGQAWCKTHSYKGYTSYASLDDLAWRDPIIAELVTVLDIHVARFARSLAFDLGRRKLALDSLWVNILEPGGMHAGHIHPGSVVSGTYYVALPAGAAGLKFEDPRLQQMMAAPPRKPSAGRRNKAFVEIAPNPAPSCSGKAGSATKCRFRGPSRRASPSASTTAGRRGEGAPLSRRSVTQT